MFALVFPGCAEQRATAPTNTSAMKLYVAMDIDFFESMLSGEQLRCIATHVNAKFAFANVAFRSIRNLQQFLPR
jgi:hypothetical protein